MRAVLLVGCATLSVLFARSAVAQSDGASGDVVGEPGNISVRLLKAGDREFADNKTWSPITPIGDAACRAGTITVWIGALPSADSFPVVEAWLATGQGQCEKGDRKARSATSGSSNNCTQLPVESEGELIARPSATLEVPITELCKLTGEWAIYFLALDSPGGFESAKYYGVLKLTLDRTPPAPPENLRADVGEDTVEVSWDVPETAKRTWLLVDTNAQPTGAGDEKCSSEIIQDNGEFDPNALEALPDGVFVVTEERGVSTHSFDRNEDFPGRDLVAVTVLASDPAGNPSRMSNKLCLEVGKPKKTTCSGVPAARRS